MLLKMKKATEKVGKLWSEALMDAADNYSGVKGEGEVRLSAREDINNRKFSYAELVAKGNLNVTPIGSTTVPPITSDGKIDVKEILSQVRLNIKVGAETAQNVALEFGGCTYIVVPCNYYAQDANVVIINNGSQDVYVSLT